MGKRREQKPLSPRVEPPLAFDEEDEEEPPPRYASRTELDDDEEGCSWNQVRAAGLGAMLILFVIVVAVLPAPKNATFSKLLLKRSKPKPLWPPPGHEVPGCNPVGNASKGQPVARQSRVFLLQRDERKNLADMINYHRQVLAPDQIVILDHRSDDSLTRRVLSRFNAAGGHVWKCERDFAQHRADMMSAVMRLYAPYSTFLVPLEADEMLAVAARGGGLAWSAPELSGALASLPEPKALFKLRTTAGVPHDCPDMPQEEQASRAAEVATEGLVAEKCLGAAKPLEPFSCGSRTFYRGAEVRPRPISPCLAPTSPLTATSCPPTRSPHSSWAPAPRTSSARRARGPTRWPTRGSASAAGSIPCMASRAWWSCTSRWAA